MFNYYFDARNYTELLQYLSLFLLFIIGAMIYFLSNDTVELTEDIKEDISKLDLVCPKCPEHPKIPGCPACPTCPDLTCDTDGRCPQCPDRNECPDCPDVNSNCPNVEDIVSGIFPGRNPGITSGGKYFDIKANDSYELMPSYDLYNPVDAFPSDSILSAPGSLIGGNTDVPITQMGNSIGNDYIDTSSSESLSRMNMADQGQNTGPSSLPGPTLPGPTLPDPTLPDPTLPDPTLPDPVPGSPGTGP
jgi:hypothetical protein